MPDVYGDVVGASAGSKKKKPRLGRGLSSLIGAPPVQVDSNEGAAGEREGGDAAGEAGAVSGGGSAGVAEVGSAAAAIPAERVVELIPLGRIRVNPMQPRRVFDGEKLRELARSIERSGVMQPVVVREVRREERGTSDEGRGRGDGEGGGAGWKPVVQADGGAGWKPAVQFELIAGERRWRAAGLAGLEAIPAIVREVSDEVSAEWALIENVQREDLGPLEKGAAFRVLSERFGLTQEEIAQRVGLDRSSVSNLMRLMELEEEICEMLDRGSLGLGHGKALLACAPGGRRVALARKAAVGAWPVRKLEEAVRAGGESLADAAQRVGREASALRDSGRPDSIRELEKQLGEHLGTKVKVTGGKDWKRGKIVIEFFDLDQFDGLMGKMGFAMRE